MKLLSIGQDDHYITPWRRLLVSFGLTIIIVTGISLIFEGLDRLGLSSASNVGMIIVFFLWILIVLVYTGNLILLIIRKLVKNEILLAMNSVGSLFVLVYVNLFIIKSVFFH